MPTVDFTLDDIKQLLDQRLDERFVAEREHTRQMVRKEVREEVQDQFNSFIKHTFQPFVDHVDERFNSLERDVKGLKRTVRKHSADITELQAAAGL